MPLRRWLQLALTDGIGPILSRRIIDRWTYTRGLTNSEKALLEELVSELEAGR